jgi:hypothetical protein
MKNRWWLAAGLVSNLGLAPLALAQEGKARRLGNSKLLTQSVIVKISIDSRGTLDSNQRNRKE